MLLKILTLVSLISLAAAVLSSNPNNSLSERFLKLEVNNSLTKDTGLQPLMKNALLLKKSIGFEANCTGPVTIALNKCEETLLHSSASLATGVVFSQEWIRELSTPTSKNCAKVYVEVTADKKTTCFLKFWIRDPIPVSRPKTLQKSFNPDQQQSNHVKKYTINWEDDGFENRNNVNRLKKAFDSDARLSYGKCGFLLPDKIRRTSEAVRKFQRLSKLTCETAKENSVDIFVTPHQDNKTKNTTTTTTTNTKTRHSSGAVFLALASASLAVVGVFKLVRRRYFHANKYARLDESIVEMSNFNSVESIKIWRADRQPLV